MDLRLKEEMVLIDIRVTLKDIEAREAVEYCTDHKADEYLIEAWCKYHLQYLDSITIN